MSEFEKNQQNIIETRSLLISWFRVYKFDNISISIKLNYRKCYNFEVTGISKYSMVESYSLKEDLIENCGSSFGDLKS